MSSFISDSSSMNSNTGAMMPKLASYVVFSIDPVATLEALDDPHTTRAARKMRNKKYLGYVSDAVSVFDDEARYQSYTLQLARRGMASRSADNFIESDMCVPILPATDHPLGRTPLCASPPLPWADCYQPSCHCKTTVRVRYRYEDYSSATRLDLDDLSRHERIKREDNARRNALIAAHRALHPLPTPPPPENDLDSISFASNHSDEVSGCPINEDETALDHEGVLCPTSAIPVARELDDHIVCDEEGSSRVSDGTLPGQGAHETNDDNVSEDSCDDIADFFAAMIEMTRPPETMVVVEVSYDLASISSPADPEDFFKELAYLEQLEKESKERAIVRARKIDEKAFRPRKKLGAKMLFHTADAFIHAHRRLMNVLPKLRLSAFLRLERGKPRQHDFAFRRGQEVVP